MDKILVTPRSLTRQGHRAFDLLRQAGFEVVFCTPGKQPSEEELLTLLPDCVGYLAGVEKISAKVLEAAKNLRVISRNGTGIDNIDLEAAKRLNIRICRTEGANARGVAELTIALIFALVRAISFSDAHLKGQEWQRRKGVELENRTLGLIGCGEIGKLVALMTTDIGMKVVAFDCHPESSFSPNNFSWVALEDLYRQSDIISLHLPALEKPLIDKETIAKMKEGVYLINTARASLLDEDAVLQALESGHIAGVAVDAFIQEPPLDYRLVRHDRVIATPHIGGFTNESVDRAVAMAVDNLLAVFKQTAEN